MGRHKSTYAAIPAGKRTIQAITRLQLPGLLLFVHLVTSTTLRAQDHSIELYRVTVVTNAGNRVRGLLYDVSESKVSLRRDNYYSVEEVSLNTIRKIVLRRNSKKNAMLTGAVIVGLMSGFTAYQSLQKNQTRSPFFFGLTLTFATVAGAGAGFLAGSAIGNRASLIIRPQQSVSRGESPFRQLEPFTIRYQQDVINNLSTSS